MTLTLGEFVRFGHVGSYELRLEFETEMLNRWFDLILLGHEAPAFDKRMTDEAWVLSFRYWWKVRLHAIAKDMRLGLDE